MLFLVIVISFMSYCLFLDCISIVYFQGEDTEWVTVKFIHPEPSADDWIAVFSPAKFKYLTSPYSMT